MRAHAQGEKSVRVQDEGCVVSWPFKQHRQVASLVHRHLNDQCEGGVVAQQPTLPGGRAGGSTSQRSKRARCRTHHHDQLVCAHPRRHALHAAAQGGSQQPLQGCFCASGGFDFFTR